MGINSDSNQNSFYTQDELMGIGFKTIGKNVKISRFAHFYANNQISIGDNVRIDDFCLLSGCITLKNNIHISAYSALYGGGGIEMDDYSGLSPRCTLLSATDDFSGDFLIGPQHQVEYTNVIKGLIKIGKYCQLGSNTVVLPNVVFGEGSVTAAMSFVNKSLNKWSIYGGIPVRFMKMRSKNLLNFING